MFHPISFIAITTNITQSIECLLNQCPRLTHLSLTGVDAFLRPDLSVFCREAPDEFNAHQRQVFCVFSGVGVTGLRKYLNEQRNRAEGPIELPGDSDVEELAEGRQEDDDDDDDDATMTGMMAGAVLAEQEVDGEVEGDAAADADAEDYVVLSSAATPTNANA